MVGLVIVSHSRALAKALVDLVSQVSTNKIQMAFAGGIGPDRDEFGTDAIEIMEAIQSVYSEDGVLVLMDLGSAILSAEMALELLPPEIAEKVRFCAAPVVEGAIAAGVQAGLGSDLDTVCAEARAALGPKIEHIGGVEASVLVAEATPVEDGEAEEVIVTLKNLHGLHARPAAQFVQKAGNFDAHIQVKNLTTGKGPVSAKSLNALATLGAVEEHQIAITASGLEAEQALKALTEMVEDAFGEELASESPVEAAPIEVATPPVEGAERAVPISEGVALGPLFRYQVQLPPIPLGLAEDPQAEWEKLDTALGTTRKEIRRRRDALAASVGKAESAIFDAHLLILDDPDLLAQVRTKIFDEQNNAAAAWDAAIRAVAESYRALDDPYLQGRATDVIDVGNQMLFALAGKQEAPAVVLDDPVILFAEELTPTETAQLDMSKILGIITVSGGPTSHSAILSRALGIPAVSGTCCGGYADLKDGTLIALDGFTGDVWVDPPQEIQTQVREKRDAWLAQRAELLKSSHAPGATKDGARVEVVANVGNAVDAKAALKNGAEGVGLLRTEFLYLTRETPPTEDEQVQSLVEIAAALAGNGEKGRPIVVRTLDVGGDKGLPYIDMPDEENPFLGVRAIRLSLRRQELFITQLRAILRAGDGYHFKVMFPMVANLSEVLAARKLLEEAHLALEKEGLAHQWPVETGIMIEVPAAALLADAIAPHVDFFSVGTNDLTQYTMAAERGNPDLAELADAVHPAVLRLIGRVVDAAHANDAWVGVCGELAGDPMGSALLVGLGVDELSMNASAIPRAKAVLRASDLSELQALSQEALQAPGAPQVRELAGKFLEGRV